MSKERSEIDLMAVFGTDEAEGEAEEIQLGSFRLSIEGGQIASIHHGGREICRGLTYLVRDRNWATLSASTMYERRGRGVRVVHGRAEGSGIAFNYTIEITEDQGDLVVTSHGEAHSDFAANRIGFSFLHPTPDCTGRPVLCRHGDGTTEKTGFPRSISPDQPMLRIAGLSYAIADGGFLEIDFKATRGADREPLFFEMEDQRNWGDASFKTYVGSLFDPWPFDVRKGDVFSQTIRIHVSEDRSTPPPPGSQRNAHVPGFRLPSLGLNVPEGMASSCLDAVRRYGCPPVAFLSAYLATSRLSKAELAHLAELVAEVDLPLRIELEVNGAPEDTLRAAAEEIAAAGIAPFQIIPCQAVHLKSFQPSGPWPDAMPLGPFFSAARMAFPTSEIGGGSLTYFPELNRLRPPAQAVDSLGFSYCPIVHAADERTILQNARTLRDMDGTLAEHFAEKPWHVLSGALSMRLNPYGAKPEPNPDNRRLAMAEDDPRDRAEFGAYWRLCLLTVLGSTRAASACLGAMAGPSSVYLADGAGPTFELLADVARLSPTDKGAFAALSETFCRDLLLTTCGRFGPPGAWNVF